jgi:hypothetical protein
MSFLNYTFPSKTIKKIVKLQDERICLIIDKLKSVFFITWNIPFNCKNRTRWFCQVLEDVKNRGNSWQEIKNYEMKKWTCHLTSMKTETMKEKNCQGRT